MSRILNYVITSYLLGIDNLLKVLIYRAFKKLRIFKICQKIKDCPSFEIIANDSKIVLDESKEWHLSCKKKTISYVESLLEGKAIIFGNKLKTVGSPPNWFKDPFSIYSLRYKKKHWSYISDNDEIDIKNLWELSRFNWITTLARGWCWTKDKSYIRLLNLWTDSWCKENPINSGINWMCGQEVSIRLINIMLAWYMIEGKNLTKNVSNNRIDFVIAHLDRIFSTKFYADAQNNNHSISESAALYIGGQWLSKASTEKSRIGNHYKKMGKKCLENNICKLVQHDGSFSQNSVNYHRFLVDTLCQVEIWRKFFDDNLFSTQFIQRCKLSIEWLEVFVDPSTGKSPNLGANDGAFCYQLNSLPYNNFKSTLQLSNFLFKNKIFYPPGPWDETLYVLGFKYESLYEKKDNLSKLNGAFKNKKQIFYFSEGGYVVIKINDISWSLLRLPRYKFRPSQCDPLHFDLWKNGENIFRDGGSFSYNTSKNLMNYFSGIQSHNSVQFDEFNQMPRISRFLWGNWLKTESEPLLIDGNTCKQVSSSYKCKFGKHKRTVKVDNLGMNWEIIDEIKGSFKQVTLRWRLCERNWEIKGKSLTSKDIKIKVRCNKKISSFKLNTGLESIYYQSKNEIKVLEIKCKTSPIKISTFVEFSKY